MLFSIIAPPRPTVESAQLQMAVGVEGAHPQLLGEHERLSIGCLRLLHVWKSSLRGDLPGQAKRIRLTPALLSLPGELEGVARRACRVVYAAGQEVRFPEPRDQNRVLPHPIH